MALPLIFLSAVIVRDVKEVVEKLDDVVVAVGSLLDDILLVVDVDGLVVMKLCVGRMFIVRQYNKHTS